jgi:hypothetical protein
MTKPEQQLQTASDFTGGFPESLKSGQVTKYFTTGGKR